MGFGETMKALSDPARREILALLKGGRLSAGEIASHFAMTGPTVSYHLKTLKKADLLYETREKNFIYYDLNTSVLEDVLLWLTDLTGRSGETESPAGKGEPSPDAGEEGPRTVPRAPETSGS